MVLMDKLRQRELAKNRSHMYLDKSITLVRSLGHGISVMGDNPTTAIHVGGNEICELKILSN